jgi:hypothetical protein
MYSAKLVGLKPKDVLHLINTLPAHIDMKVAQTPSEVAVDKPNGRSNVGLDDKIMLGAIEKARKGTLKGNLVAEVEQYEKDHGAGEMTKRKLRDKLKAHSAAPDAVVGAALKAGIIKGA